MQLDKRRIALHDPYRLTGINWEEVYRHNLDSDNVDFFKNIETLIMKAEWRFLECFETQYMNSLFQKLWFVKTKEGDYDRDGLISPIFLKIEPFDVSPIYVTLQPL